MSTALNFITITGVPKPCVPPIRMYAHERVTRHYNECGDMQTAKQGADVRSRGLNSSFLLKSQTSAPSIMELAIAPVRRG